MLFLVLEIVASFIESYMVFWVYSKIFDKNFKKKKSIIVASVLTLTVFLLNQAELFSIYTSLIGILIIALGIYIVYKDNYIDSLAITGLYMILVYIADFFAITLLGYTLGKPDFATDVMKGVSIERSVMLILAKMFTFLVSFNMANVLRKIYWKRKELYFVILLATIILYYFIQQTFNRANISTLLMWIYLLIIISSSIYAIMRHKTIMVEKEKQMLENEVQYMSEQNYKMYAQNFANNRFFYHDLKNHLIVLREYLGSKQYQKAEEYINNLRLPISSEKEEKITGNKSLDILLNNKKMLAQQEEIKVLIVSEEIKLKLSECEMIALFGNLLDNAIEACKKLERDNRKIQLIIRRVNDMTFIKISNTYREVKVDNNQFLSDKKEMGEHGIGLSSIYTIVEKYEGIVRIDYRDGFFEVLISFFSK